MQNDDETVGRVLLASLHQAIWEVLPARLEFYESWLRPSELHKRTIDVGSFMAAISVLRHEGDAYDVVTTRAGQYAALWSFEELFAVKRAFVRALPHHLRARVVSRLIGRMLHNLYAESRADMTWRGSTIFVDVQKSPFCVTPGPADQPFCGFYASAIAEFLRLFDLHAAVRVSRCRALGAKSCLLLVLTDQVRTGPHTSTLGLTTAPPIEPVPQPSSKPSPADVDLQPADHVIPIVTESREPASAAAAPPAHSLPETESSETDWVQIEMQWAKVAATIPAAVRGAVERGTATRAETDRESDPEAPWRRL